MPAEFDILTEVLGESLPGWENATQWNPAQRLLRNRYFSRGAHETFRCRNLVVMAWELRRIKFLGEWYHWDRQVEDLRHKIVGWMLDPVVRRIYAGADHAGSESKCQVRLRDDMRYVWGYVGSTIIPSKPEPRTIRQIVDDMNDFEGQVVWQVLHGGIAPIIPERSFLTVECAAEGA